MSVQSVSTSMHLRVFILVVVVISVNSGKRIFRRHSWRHPQLKSRFTRSSHPYDDHNDKYNDPYHQIKPKLLIDHDQYNKPYHQAKPKFLTDPNQYDDPYHPQFLLDHDQYNEPYHQMKPQLLPDHNQYNDPYLQIKPQFLTDNDQYNDPFHQVKPQVLPDYDKYNDMYHQIKPQFLAKHGQYNDPYKQMKPKSLDLDQYNDANLPIKPQFLDFDQYNNPKHQMKLQFPDHDQYNNPNHQMKRQILDHDQYNDPHHQIEPRFSLDDDQYDDAEPEIKSRYIPGDSYDDYPFSSSNPWWKNYGRYNQDNDYPFYERSRYNPYRHNDYGYGNNINRKNRHHQESMDQTCGISYKITPLIVNGEEFEDGTYPWLTAVFAVRSTGLRFICGGTLVSRRHVITAGHCVERGNSTVDAKDLVVVLGKCDLSNITAADTFRLTSVLRHPDYKVLSGDGDLAVLVLEENLTFTETIRPACIWTGSNDLEEVVGYRGIVTGWGKTQDGALSLTRPKAVKMPVVSQETCLRSNAQYISITSERTFCAGGRDGAGPCNGDSGGGFIMQKAGQWILRGIVSLSLSNGLSGVSCDLYLFIVFTDASKYSDWLNTVIK